MQKKRRFIYDITHGAVDRKRAAAFFCSTYFFEIIVRKRKNDRIRAPPSEFDFTKPNLKSGDYIMTIKYKFADGTVSVVEVEDKLGQFILKSRKDEENLSRKERYHSFSIEGCLYEGIELSTDESPEKILQREIDKMRLEERFDEAVNSLSQTQRRRLTLLVKGLSMRDIGCLEGVSSHSVAKSIWGARKIFLKFFPERGSQNGGKISI